MTADYCAICGYHLNTIGDGGLCAECRADWDDDDLDIAELEQAWPQLPLGLEGIDRFSEHEITGELTEEEIHVRHQTYICAGCRQVRPWRDGAADDMPDHCDACWYQAHHPAATTPLSDEVFYV